MIKIETRIVGKDEENQYVEIKKYRVKHTTTAEHLCCIDVLVRAILDKDENMNINELFKLIKANVKETIMRGDN